MVKQLLKGTKVKNIVRTCTASSNRIFRMSDYFSALKIFENRFSLSLEVNFGHFRRWYFRRWTTIGNGCGYGSYRFPSLNTL